MKNIVEIKINKTSFRFEETIYEAEKEYFIKKIIVDYRSISILFKIRGDEHNPPHIHIFYNISDFYFDLTKQKFQKADIKKKDYLKLKNNKLLYEAIINYLKYRKEELINSFYIENPTLKSKK
ncbi:MAG: hypothetical protein L3J74_08060 [Bacteroidales bacterium]|nr:hypothetical protein [Bacteroidales bacterium]